MMARKRERKSREREIDGKCREVKGKEMRGLEDRSQEPTKRVFGSCQTGSVQEDGNGWGEKKRRVDSPTSQEFQKGAYRGCLSLNVRVERAGPGR